MLHPAYLSIVMRYASWESEVGGWGMNGSERGFRGRRGRVKAGAAKPFYAWWLGSRGRCPLSRQLRRWEDSEES